MKNKDLRFFIIGLRLSIFPPDPPIGDFKALKEWKPIRCSIIECIKLRIKLRFWGYTCIYNPKK
nr:MAG TPA: hypothetical protein [Caudoviricetes sp.]